MSAKYFLMLQHADGKVSIANTGKSYVASTEENRYLLREMGDKLIDDGTIEGYQLAMLVGYPTLKEDRNMSVNLD